MKTVGVTNNEKELGRKNSTVWLLCSAFYHSVSKHAVIRQNYSYFKDGETEAEAGNLSKHAKAVAELESRPGPQIIVQLFMHLLALPLPRMLWPCLNRSCNIYTAYIYITINSSVTYT